MKVLLSALGLADTATEAQALERFNGLQNQSRELLVLTGKDTLPEALGVIQAWKQSAGQAQTALARVAELEGQVKAGELHTMIEAGKKDGKITPALEAWAKTQDITALKAFLEVAPVVVQKTEHQEPVSGGGNNPDGAMTHNGKTWNQMDNVEKHNLYLENNALYRAMKGASN
jgi:phage I-like protein